MMSKRDMFWTDTQQARERLQNSVVMYDGEPVYVENIQNGEDFDDLIPRASIYFCKEPKKRLRKKLDSPKFKKFRELPPLGFMLSNNNSRCLFMYRTSNRTRIHGLSQRNVSVLAFNPESGANEYFLRRDEYNFSSIYFDPGFVAACESSFPSLSKILLNIKELSALPYSHKFAVYRDSIGIRWLYRNSERVGFFSGADTLNLLEKTAFYREEIMEDPLFTLNNIREY